MKTTITEKKKKNEKINEKNRWKGPDIEHFYRFINANNLRHEAYTMLSHVVSMLKGKSKKRKKKKIIQ